MNISTLLNCFGCAAMTSFLYWLPRSERWISFREERRAMVPYQISVERFEQMERILQVLLPLMGLLVTVALFVKLLTEA